VVANAFDVTAFGAVGDYDVIAGTGTDCTAAFRAAWAAALDHARRFVNDVYLNWLTTVGIYVPAGRYYVDLSDDLLEGRSTAQPVRGSNISGDGSHQSIVYLKGGAFFINNANTLGFFRIQSIGFVGLTGHERLMSMWSGTDPKTGQYMGGNAQSVDRYDVHTHGLAQLYDIAGDANADCCSHVLCRDVQSTQSALPFISLNNLQSVQHTFVACHAEVRTTYFHVIAGGNINWYGGAIHIYKSGDAVLKIEGVGSTFGGMFSFTGVHFECEHPAGVLRSTSEDRIAFRDCDLMVMEREQADSVGFELQRGILTIDRCSLNLRIAVSSAEDTYRSQEAPFVQVSDCMLYKPSEELVVIRPPLINTGGKGKVKFTNCRGMSADPVNVLWHGDCYINYDTGFDTHARTPNVICLQASPENGRGLPDGTARSFAIAGGRAFIYMIKIVNRSATPQAFAVKAPSGAILATSRPGHKYSTAMCDLEITPSEKLSVANLTDKHFADGYILVFYI
jgi:hypothetical protein